MKPLTDEEIRSKITEIKKEIKKLKYEIGCLETCQKDLENWVKSKESL